MELDKYPIIEIILIPIIPKSESLPPSRKTNVRQTLYAKIYDSIRQQILDGQLKFGARLPSSRNYAIEIGVSRTSVISALEQLKAEGYISAKQGSGYFVNSIGDVAITSQLYTEDSIGKQTENLALTKLPMHAGAADMSLFPYRQWSKCISKVARSQPRSIVVNADSFGDRNLREAITRYLFDWRGINVASRQILITAGSIDGLGICIRTLLNKTSKIGLENPGYLVVRNLVKQVGYSPKWLAVDNEGAQVPKFGVRNSSSNLVILTPSHQYPLGGAMSLARRAKFINWANSTNSWIIEDDYDSEFRYSGKPIPALTGLDSFGRAIYVGSFSNIFSTGLRLGFLVIPSGLIESFSNTLSRFGSNASIAMQPALSEFINTGEFYRHIRRVRRTYGERRNLLINCLESKLNDIVTFEDHHAGMQIAISLPDQFCDRDVSNALLDKGVFMPALSTFYAGKKHKNGVLIGFCSHQSNVIIQNVSVLRQVLYQRMGTGHAKD